MVHEIFAPFLLERLHDQLAPLTLESQPQVLNHRVLEKSLSVRLFVLVKDQEEFGHKLSLVWCNKFANWLDQLPIARVSVRKEDKQESSSIFAILGQGGRQLERLG